MPGPVPYLDAATPIALAHRGGAAYGPNRGIENTVRAFCAAVDMGYRYLETDVHATVDGEVYAFHDDTLDRVTDSSGALAALPSDVVARAKIHGTEPIPTLRELLQDFPTTRFNIDVKADTAVGPTVAVVRAAGAFQRVCLASFSHQRMLRIRELAPEATTSASAREVAAVVVGPTRRARRRAVAGGAVALQVPPRHLRVSVATARFLDRAHDLGLHVHVWTIDDPGQMAALLDLGVDGLVSDRIDLLRDVLLQRGQWSSHGREQEQ